jgi:hypothetical protein
MLLSLPFGQACLGSPEWLALATGSWHVDEIQTAKNLLGDETVGQAHHVLTERC